MKRTMPCCTRRYPLYRAHVSHDSLTKGTRCCAAKGGWLQRKRLRLCRDPASRSAARDVRQDSGDVRDVSEEWIESRAALERVVSEIEDLISEKSPALTTLQRDAHQQLSRCLMDLHANLEKSREVMQNSTEEGEKEKELSRLDVELTTIKQRVVELKDELMAWNRKDALALERCMKELDAISFEEKDGFSENDMQQLDKEYTAFKDVMRAGEDGVVCLMQLVRSVRSMKEGKTAEERQAIETFERETMTYIFDIYTSLFPGDAAEKKPVQLSSRPATSPSSTVISTATVPHEAETWKGGTGGGSGGSNDDGGDSGGSSDSSDGENSNEGIAWGFWLVFSFLLLAVSAVVFLPEDKAQLKQKLSWDGLKFWFQKVTGTAPPPPPIEPKGTKKGRKRR